MDADILAQLVELTQAVELMGSTLNTCLAVTFGFFIWFVWRDHDMF